MFHFKRGRRSEIDPRISGKKGGYPPMRRSVLDGGTPGDQKEQDGQDAAKERAEKEKEEKEKAAEDPNAVVSFTFVGEVCTWVEKQRYERLVLEAKSRRRSEL